MVIFNKSFNGKAKDSGKPFQLVSLIEVHKNENGKFEGRIVDFFVDSVDCEGLQFGDIVSPIFQESAFLGGKARLIKVEPKGQNIFSLLEK